MRWRSAPSTMGPSPSRWPSGEAMPGEGAGRPRAMWPGSQEALGLRVGMGLCALSCLAPEEISLNFHPCSESGLVGSPWVDRGAGSRLVRIPPLVRVPLPSPLMSLFYPHAMLPAATTLLPGSMRAKPSSGQPCSTRRKATPSIRPRWAAAGTGGATGPVLRAALIPSCLCGSRPCSWARTMRRPRRALSTSSA